jgi:hypothetical protein
VLVCELSWVSQSDSSGIIPHIFVCEPVGRREIFHTFSLLVEIEGPYPRVYGFRLWDSGQISFLRKKECLLICWYQGEFLQINNLSLKKLPVGWVYTVKIHKLFINHFDNFTRYRYWLCKHITNGLPASNSIYCIDYFVYRHINTCTGVDYRTFYITPVSTNILVFV